MQSVFCFFKFFCILFIFIIFIVLRISKEKDATDEQHQTGGDLGGSEATVEVAGMEKRQHKPTVVMKSPYLNEFGSSKPKAAGKRPAHQINVVKQVLPFEMQLGFNSTKVDTDEFSKWHYDCYRPKNK